MEIVVFLAGDLLLFYLSSQFFPLVFFRITDVILNSPTVEFYLAIFFCFLIIKISDTEKSLKNSSHFIHLISQFITSLLLTNSTSRVLQKGNCANESDEDYSEGSGNIASQNSIINNSNKSDILDSLSISLAKSMLNGYRILKLWEI